MTGTGARHVLDALRRAIDGGEPVTLATIVAASGSVPRHAGTKMLIHSDGTIEGTIGGGKFESVVIEAALATFASGKPTLETYDLREPEQGDPGVCGGSMSVYLEPYMPPHTVYVIGAGHVGKAVVDLAHWLGYRTVAVDDRPELLAADAMPSATVRFAGTVEDAIAEHPITEDTSVVVVTRSPDLDAGITPALLATPAAYIGVMGSRRRWAITRRQLEEQGIADRDLERISQPIGRDIGAETVEEIAVSIMAEVIDAVNGDES